jgi:hypothetical protein
VTVVEWGGGRDHEDSFSLAPRKVIQASVLRAQRHQLSAEQE